MSEMAHPLSDASELWEALIVGGGLAGLSAAIYLGRAKRRTVVIDDGNSLAVWEPQVENYLGFPRGIAGAKLLELGRAQAGRYGVEFCSDTILHAERRDSVFHLTGKREEYRAARLLLATGLYHLPPEIPSVDECLGKSMFFCKDCDGFRVQGQRVAIVGSNNEAVEYALAMLAYSPCVMIAPNGRNRRWDEQHERWIEEYEIPIYHEPVTEVEHTGGKIASLTFSDGQRVAVDAAFTTRGDIYHNAIARDLGARADDEGQVIVDDGFRTSVPGLYAAGCVTPANCQMIIAAGQGAMAAQCLNRDLFETSLRTHSLRRFRAHQLRNEQTVPETIEHAP